MTPSELRKTFVTGTACMIALIGACVGLATIGPDSPSDRGCAGHGGVVRTTQDTGIHTTYFVCRDGFVVKR